MPKLDRRQPLLLRLLMTLCLLWLALPAIGGDGEPDDGLFTFVLENDVLGEKSTDANYTNGFKLAWMTPKGGGPAWIERSGQRLVPQGVSADSRIEFEIGQSMFTPDDITRPIPDPSDRPYAGLAYVSLGLVNPRSDRWMDQYQLLLGVVGPSSRAKEVQRWWHEVVSAREPRGWDTQIRDQFAGEFRFQRTRILGAAESDSGLYRAEFSPHFGASFGNLTTSANAGLGFRLGRRLPVDFGPPRISPSLPGSGYYEPRGDGFGWYLFGGIEARYVARSLVLDEPSRLGAGVDRRPWVADAQGGIAVYWSTFRLAFTQVVRSREFEQQRDKYSSFGAISLTWRY